MKELSLNILDITENSVKAKATLVEIVIEETDKHLIISIVDNGTGMTEETLRTVENPFYTTRTTRKVGMGIPLLKFACEQTGGSLTISSKHIKECEDHGTVVKAVFNKTHIDFTPLGDIISTLITLVQGHSDIDFIFKHTFNEKSVFLDTREIRAILEDVPLDTYEVLSWIRDNLTEQYSDF